MFDIRCLHLLVLNLFQLLSRYILFLVRTKEHTDTAQAYVAFAIPYPQAENIDLLSKGEEAEQCKFC